MCEKDHRHFLILITHKIKEVEKSYHMNCGKWNIESGKWNVKSGTNTEISDLENSKLRLLGSSLPQTCAAYITAVVALQKCFSL